MTKAYTISPPLNFLLVDDRPLILSFGSTMLGVVYAYLQNLRAPTDLEFPYSNFQSNGESIQ